MSMPGESLEGASKDGPEVPPKFSAADFGVSFLRALAGELTGGMVEVDGGSTVRLHVVPDLQDVADVEGALDGVLAPEAFPADDMEQDELLRGGGSAPEDGSLEVHHEPRRLAEETDATYEPAIMPPVPSGYGRIRVARWLPGGGLQDLGSVLYRLAGPEPQHSGLVVVDDAEEPIDYHPQAARRPRDTGRDKGKGGRPTYSESPKDSDNTLHADVAPPAQDEGMDTPVTTGNESAAGKVTVRRVASFALSSTRQTIAEVGANAQRKIAERAAGKRDMRTAAAALQAEREAILDDPDTQDEVKAAFRSLVQLSEMSKIGGLPIGHISHPKEAQYRKIIAANGFGIDQDGYLIKLPGYERRSQPSRRNELPDNDSYGPWED